VADEKPVDLVFEGGGVKGIGLAGAFRKLDEDGWKPQRVAGTSAGAITAALVAAGYNGAQLEDTVLNEMDFRRFADGEGDLVRETWELLHESGLHSGKYFLGWIKDLLEAKGVTRFGDLRVAGAGEDPARQHRLQVIASDLSTRSMLILPRDAGELGLEPDELNVAEAVRMSMSIPIFFTPWRQRRGDAVHTIVDGGLLSNFPVWLFDTKGGEEPRWPTFGLLLVAPGQREPLPGDPDASTDVSLSSIEYLKAIAHTMLEAHDRLYLEQAEFARTIPIPTLGVNTTQFDIDDRKKRELFQSGVDAATAFLATWDFEKYKSAFRDGAAPTSRRERLQEWLDAKIQE
jgi:NTE family protein